MDPPSNSSSPSASTSTSHPPPSTSASNPSTSTSQPPSSSDPISTSGSSSQPPSTSEGSGSGSASDPELPGGDSSSSMQWKSTSTGDHPENEEDMDVDHDTTNSSIPTEVQPKSSAEKGKMIDTGSSSSGSAREGKAEEIGLLTDLYSLHNKTGRYYFSGADAQLDFYKFWIQEERDYKNKEELDNKIDELHARFLKNMDKNVEGPTDPIDVEILRLSEWIWGHEIDSGEETDDDEEDDGDQDDGSKDLTDANAVEGVDTDPNVSSDKHETDEARDQGVDRMDSKDSTKESGSVAPVNKD